MVDKLSVIQSSRISISIVSCLVAGGLFNPPVAYAANEPLESAKASHISARESIRTFSAKIKCDGIQPTRPNIIGANYWRSHDIVRIQLNRATDGSNDFLVKDGELKQVVKGNDYKNRRYYLARVSPSSASIGLCDVWSMKLLDLALPEGGQVPLERFLERAESTPRAKSDMLDGLPCVRISMTIKTKFRGDYKYVIWLDPSRNHLVRKIEIVFGKTPSRVESEITEFTEAAPGIHFPIRCVTRCWDGDNYSESSSTLRDVRVNTPIPASTFVLPTFPDGTILENEILGVKYPVDKQWRKTGPEEPLVRLSVAASEDEYSAFNAPSTTEPRSLSRIYIEAAILVFALASAIVVIRRRRNGSVP